MNTIKQSTTTTCKQFMF